MVSALTWPAPAALALAAPRTPLRDAGIYALQMWAYFAHFDMPDDDPDAAPPAAQGRLPDPLRPRARARAPPPTIRLQRSLGREGARRAARVRALGGALELVPRPARHARLHPAAPPRARTRAPRS